MSTVSILLTSLVANNNDEIYPYNADANGEPVQNLYKFAPYNNTTRLRRVEKTVPYLTKGAPVFSKSTTQTLDQTAVANGQIDLASSAVIKKGSTPPSGVTGQFAALASVTAGVAMITWYWDGTNGSSPLVIHRIDGTSFSVPPGSITIGNLAPSTTYYFLPFWSVTGGCSVGWVTGFHGTPQIAFLNAEAISTNTQYYIAQQQQQNREQLTNGFMTYATPAAGSSSGGGGGGGSTGSCVMNGTFVDPIGDYGSMRQEIVGHNYWISIVTDNGRQLSGTYDHPVYACWDDDVQNMVDACKDFDEQKADLFRTPMEFVEMGMHVMTNDGPAKVINWYKFSRACSKRVVHMERGHLFWANGILSHNKMNPL